jgi:ribokinase
MTIEPQRVLVLGSLNMDLVVSVTNHPRPGDTVLGKDVRTYPGGKGANQAAAAALAGGNVSMLGRVGCDSYGQELRSALASVGVKTNQVINTAGPTGMAFITVDDNGENMIVVSSGANRRFLPIELGEGDFENVTVLLMQLELPLNTVTRAAAMASERAITVILNAAPVTPLPNELLSQISVLVVNAGEAESLTGLTVNSVPQAEIASRQLRDRGVGTAILTLGSSGAYWQSATKGGLIRPHPVDVIDTTAAGDAFCGALATGLAQGHGLERGLRFANAAGALTVTRMGAQPSLPTKIEINELMRSSTSRPKTG